MPTEHPDADPSSRTDDDQLQDDVETALRRVRDPDAEVNVFEAGLVEDIHVTDGRVIVEADLGDDAQDIVELGEDICHVHSALIEELHADISIESGV
jgi:hypothetical protein